MKVTLKQELAFRRGEDIVLTLEQALDLGYGPTLMSWANGMAHQDMSHGFLAPRGFPYGSARDIPKEYLNRMGIIVTTPERAFNIGV